ncbi:MAG: AAA family ATPase [Egibacteraceae bacterium]
MSYRVLLAVPDERVAAEFGALAAESDAFAVTDVVTSAADVVRVLAERRAHALLHGSAAGAEDERPGEGELDVVVLHERLGPLPVPELARQVAGHAPEIGLVLMTSRLSTELLASALRAGFRGVLQLPLGLEELQTTVESAGAWSRLVRARGPEPGADAHGDGRGGRMLVVTGAKGGVGTTTVAAHLALRAARATTSQRICLVDFDLQAGDVRSLFNLTHRRGIDDLVGVADDLSARQIDESCYVHESGLRVLLPPVQGEHAEDVDADVARRLLAALRTRFDVVIVDAGAVMSEASSVAVESAEQALLVVTCDVPAMRGANRLLSLWERLGARKDDIGVVVNRASRDSEIQPDLIAKVVGARVLSSTLAGDFRGLESASNTGRPERAGASQFAAGLSALSEELRLTPARQPRRRRRSLRADAGVVAVETAALTLTIGLTVLLLWQIALLGFTFVLGSHSAREVAREYAVSAPASSRAQLRGVARDDLPAGWREDIVVRTDEDEVSVTLTVPALVPGITSPWRVTTEAGTVREAEGEGP